MVFKQLIYYDALLYIKIVDTNLYIIQIIIK